jgi:hypothetical protein
MQNSTERTGDIPSIYFQPRSSTVLKFRFLFEVFRSFSERLHVLVQLLSVDLALKAQFSAHFGKIQHLFLVDQSQNFYPEAYPLIWKSASLVYKRKM